MPVAIKRAYEKPSLSDGQRVLVDRLWPRGVKKEQARIHHWLKNLAPSDALRQWFHGSANWPVFKKRYFRELATPEAAADLESLYELKDHNQVTLIYASKDSQHNNAMALKELLEGMRKPPSSSGPAKAAAASGRIAKRRPS